MKKAALLFGKVHTNTSQAALVVKYSPSDAEDIRDAGSIPAHEDPLEEGVATHSSILAWRIPQTEEPGRRQFIGLQRVGYDGSDLACMHANT